MTIAVKYVSTFQWSLQFLYIESMFLLSHRPTGKGYFYFLLVDARLVFRLCVYFPLWNVSKRVQSCPFMAGFMVDEAWLKSLAWPPTEDAYDTIEVVMGIIGKTS